MATTTTFGMVEFLKFGDDFGFAQIRDEDTGTSEFFIIWSGPSGGPSGVLSMELTVAMVRGLRVEIRHGSESAFIGTLTVHGPPLPPLLPTAPDDVVVSP